MHLRTAILVLLASSGFRPGSASARVQHYAPVDGPGSVHLVIAQHVADELGALADTLRSETVRCLVGVRRGKTAVVDLVWEPAIDRTTPHELHYGSCPMATIALWHNHPRQLHSRAASACYLSRTDIDDALRPRAPEIQIVQVSSDVACWWTRSQIEMGADAEALLPFPGQQRGSTGGAVSGACQGVQETLHACARLRVENAGEMEGRTREVFGRPFAKTGGPDRPGVGPTTSGARGRPLRRS